jgi:uncharacterized protein YqeY
MSTTAPPSATFARLERDLKAAMRERDKALVSCIRQLKAKGQEAENAPQFQGPKDDAFWLDVIGKYAKMLGKSLQELAAGGERGAALVAAYGREIAYCEQFLPKAMGDDALAAAAEALVREAKLTAKDVGRGMGQLLGRHRGQIEPARAKAAIEAAVARLGGGS